MYRHCPAFIGVRCHTNQRAFDAFFTYTANLVIANGQVQKAVNRTNPRQEFSISSVLKVQISTIAPALRLNSTESPSFRAPGKTAPTAVPFFWVWTRAGVVHRPAES